MELIKYENKQCNMCLKFYHYIIYLSQFKNYKLCSKCYKIYNEEFKKLIEFDITKCDGCYEQTDDILCYACYGGYGTQYGCKRCCHKKLCYKCLDNLIKNSKWNYIELLGKPIAPLVFEPMDTKVYLVDKNESLF